MSITGKAKLTATYQGVTATRRSNRVYTHVVFGLSSAALREARHLKQARYNEHELDEMGRALALVQAGKVPAKGDELLKVTSANGYHRFTGWDNIARVTKDHGRTWRDATVAEIEARINQYGPSYERSAQYHREQAKIELAKGDQWSAISWHHSYALAQKGEVTAASNDSSITKTVIVEVSK